MAETTREKDSRKHLDQSGMEKRGAPLELSTFISWDAVLVFAYLGCGLAAATFLRRQLSFLQRLFLPNALIAGLILLLLDRQVCGLIALSHDHLNTVVHHLLTGVFIVFGLQKPRYRHGEGIITTLLAVCKSYTLLALLGIAFTLAWIAALRPDFFPSFSMLPLLGFGLDHLIAANFGLQWEQLGFTAGGWTGFSFGTAGFLWAYLGGAVLVFLLRRKKGSQRVASRSVLLGLLSREEKKPVAGHLTTAVEGIESFTLHLALIGIVFLLTYELLHRLSLLLARLGESGELASGILWSYSFAVALLIAFLARKVIDWMELGHLFDTGLFARISGAMVDFLVAGAVASIPLVLVREYWVEVLVLSLLCGAGLMALVWFISPRLHGDFAAERTAAVFGLVTGNIASSLALVRAVDPRLETPAAVDAAAAAPLSLLLGLPLFIFVNFPSPATCCSSPCATCGPAWAFSPLTEASFSWPGSW